MIDIYDLHTRMTQHLFPSFSNEDERFLALALCGEAGEIANMVKKQWRDGVDLTEEIREELADVRVYLELIAKCFDIEGEKLTNRTLAIPRPSYADEGERFLSLALCGWSGLLGLAILERWHEGNEILGTVEHRIVMVRVILELLAEQFGIGGEKLDQAVEAKLIKVAKRKGEMPE